MRTAARTRGQMRPASGTDPDSETNESAPRPVIATGSNGMAAASTAASASAALAETIHKAEGGSGAAKAPKPSRKPPRKPRRAAPKEARAPRSGELARSLEAASLERARLSLERRIRAHLPSRGGVRLTLTDNRYTMISVRRDNERADYRVRLHHMFVDADPVIARALARYIAQNDRCSSRLLGEYIDENNDKVRSRRRRTLTPKLRTKGKYFDLQAIFDDINERYFGNQIQARITWGQRTGKPRRRNSIKMGSYSVEDKLIRLHRSLDRAFVPQFFVEWIVYHEMLHQVHEIKIVNGRRQFHSKAFLEDEARFEHYVASRAWERANLEALLTY